MSHHNEPVFDLDTHLTFDNGNIHVKFTDIETRQILRIKMNSIVMARPGKPYKIGFYVREKTKVEVYAQGEEAMDGYFALTAGEWTEFDHGRTGRQWVCLDTASQDAKEIGIKQHRAENGGFMFIFKRPTFVAYTERKYQSKMIVETKTTFSCEKTIYPRDAREGRAVHRGPLDKSMDFDSGDYREAAIVYRSNSPEKEVTRSSSGYKEAAVAYGDVSNQRHSSVSDFDTDPKRDVTAMVRLVIKEPKLETGIVSYQTPLMFFRSFRPSIQQYRCLVGISKRCRRSTDYHNSHTNPSSL